MYSLEGDLINEPEILFRKVSLLPLKLQHNLKRLQQKEKLKELIKKLEVAWKDKGLKMMLKPKEPEKIC